MPMHQDLTALVEDADIHGPSMQVEATIKRVLLGVKSPEVSSFLGCCDLPNASIPRRYAEEGASRSIKALEPTPNSLRYASAAGAAHRQRSDARYRADS